MPPPPVEATAAATDDAAAAPPPPPTTTLARVPPNVVQRVHVCAPHKRPLLLLRFLERVKANATGRQQERVLIFANTAQACGEVAELIRRHDGKAVELHGKLRQSDRDKHLLAFKAGKTPVLCATDVAGRGLHVPGLKVVVNWDFPPSLETYTHRVGRAGRGGEAAEALSLFRAIDLNHDGEVTLYDMLKSVDPGMTISAIQLVKKEGGRNGVWQR